VVRLVLAFLTFLVLPVYAGAQEAVVATTIADAPLLDGNGVEIAAIPEGERIEAGMCLSTATPPTCFVRWQNLTGQIDGALAQVAWKGGTIPLAQLAAARLDDARVRDLERQRTRLRSLNHLALHAEGDSYMAGAYQVILADMIGRETGRLIERTARGGSTMAEIRARIEADPSLAYKTVVLWDGSANGYGSVEAYLAEIDAIVALLGTEHLLLIPPVTVGPSPDGAPTDYTRDMQAVRDAIAARGVLTFDPVPVLARLADGSEQDARDVAAGMVPSSLLIDDVHLNARAMQAIAEEVARTLASAGI